MKKQKFEIGQTVNVLNEDGTDGFLAIINDYNKNGYKLYLGKGKTSNKRYKENQLTIA